MFAKVKKILIYLVIIVVSGFIVLLIIGFLAEDSPSPEPSSEVVPQKQPSEVLLPTANPEPLTEASLPKPPSAPKVSKPMEVPKPVDQPVISSTPEIVKVDFPEKVSLNERAKGTLEFRDGDGDLANLVLDNIDGTRTSTVTLKSFGDQGLVDGKFNFYRTRAN